MGRTNLFMYGTALECISIISGGVSVVTKIKSQPFLVDVIIQANNNR
jgi:hypothetical protein